MSTNSRDNDSEHDRVFMMDDQETNDACNHSQEIPHSLLPLTSDPSTQQFVSWLRIGCPIACCLCSAFSDSLAIPLFQYAMLTFLLASVVMLQHPKESWGLTCRRETIKRQSSFKTVFCFIIVPLSICRAIPAMEYFRFDMASRTAYLLALGVIFCLVFAMYGVAFLQFVAWENTKGMLLLPSPQYGDRDETFDKPRFLSILASCLVFPIGTTAVFQLVMHFSPIGGVGSPAMSSGIPTMDPITLQLASLVGQIGIVFWMSSVATVAVAVGVLHLQKHQTISIQKHLILLILATATSIHIFGSLRYTNHSKGTIFNSRLKDVQTWTESGATVLQTSCLLPTVFLPDQDPQQLSSMIERTNERLRAGDDLVVWSEVAVDLDDNTSIDPSIFDWQLDTNPGAVIAVTYSEKVPNEVNTTSSSKWYNSVELLQAGESLGRYNKNNPVPVIEADVRPGIEAPKIIPIEWTPRITAGEGSYFPTSISTMNRTNVTLNVSMAICFDFDFADFIRANTHGADLVIGPSEYYASLGWNIWGDNVYRAVEGGFTLFKCSNDGISGAVNPYGIVLSAKPTIQGETYTTSVPVQPHVSTIYAASGGYCFGWTCLWLYPVIAMYTLYLNHQKHLQHDQQLQEDLPADNQPLLASESQQVP